MGRWVPGWFYEEDEADLIVYTYTVKEERGWTWCCGKCCFLLIVLALLAIPVCAVVLPMEAMLHCDCDWGLFSNQTYNFCYNEMYILDNDGA
ncbi:hypothetical protein Pelo_19579 [Pelomyxa schiedti]|nr:hypothetical protein Pelo_19579 [Pelomyxa schiedti]